MSVIKIREAQRAGARIVLGISGISGSGKTYTALMLAYGLAKGDASKVGLLDVENRRGSLYADILRNKAGAIQKFLIGDLYPPFSPARYSAAILEFQKAGVEVLVIDSGSHAWEGEGGCEDIANAPDANGRPPKVPRWGEAKREHKRFMNTMLQSDMHIILCLRAREKVKIVQREGKTEFESQGVLPICEKNTPYEMTASMMLWNGGKTREVIKCPADLVPIFGESGSTQEGYLSARHGLELRKWVDGGEPVDAKTENARATLLTVAERGAAELERAWQALPAATRKALGGHIPADIAASAQAFDEQRQAAAGDGAAADLDNLNAQVMGGNTDDATGSRISDAGPARRTLEPRGDGRHAGELA